MVRLRVGGIVAIWLCVSCLAVNGWAETAALNARLGDMARQAEWQPNPHDPRGGEPRIVFAHYMVCFSGTLEFYMREIELAQRHGIDGFALNCGQWMGQPRDPETGRLTRESHYVRDVERIFEAARRLDSGFMLCFSPDANTLNDAADNARDMVVRYYDHPNQFRLGEKRVLGAWAGNPGMYRAALDQLRAEGRAVAFVPFFYSPKFKMTWSYETVLDFFLDHPHMDGLHYFAADDSINGTIRNNAVARRVTQKLGKIYMAGAAPAYNSPNLRDFRGMEGYGAVWEGIIRDGADWVELTTWSDYNEDSNLMPFRWPPGGSRRYFNRDESYLDATGFYSAWFRTGRRPEITQDKIYFSYRNRSQWLRGEWNPDTEAWEDITMRWHGWVGRPGMHGVRTHPDQIHDDVGDYIYVTTFLTEAADLEVELAGEIHRFAQPAGIAHAAVPLAGGVPRFRLTRGDGPPLIDVHGRKQILDETTLTPEVAFPGMHLANRTWMSGAAAGPALRLVAAEGELSDDAVIETVGDRRAVRNQESEESGFAVAVTGLRTGTYNVRVTYSNPDTTEARLMLLADGAPRAEDEYEYYIPLFLPPTGEGEFATTSFLWSLYDATSRLQVRWRKSYMFGQHQPFDDDRGSVLIEAIELIPVDPVRMPEPRRPLFPELVAIPGGTFTMGTDTGKPDEGPAHQVTLAPFAIGKYEVTNEEYERFDPEHRRHRDGYSWRDREPVIYVNWFDGVNYCNWLSEQAGLRPSYTVEGREVTFHPDGEGFRLPSEAEWEYVASGRGEGRRYPWGDDEPVPGVHGNWKGQASITPHVRLRSDHGAGVVEVGSFPAGASRDGVMDLVGNVCVWVGDWFQYYTSEAKDNPHVSDRPSPYRSIRGSSWDYYGFPPEVTDREFNHPGYPGYIYIGLRVVLPEAGMRALKESPR